MHPLNTPVTSTTSERIMKSFKALGILALAVTTTIGISSCDLCRPINVDPTTLPPITVASDTVCVWIAANSDTYASEREPDMNFGRHGSLVVATGPLGVKNSYVRFTQPTFPQGTEIFYARMELYHSGRNEDGTSDDISLNVLPIQSETWGPLTLNWKNRPDRGFGPQGTIPLRLRSQTWSGTTNIADVVRQSYADPQNYFGYRITLPSEFFNKQIEKGFYSNNDRRRTTTDMGLSPRLLLKVKLPANTTTSDIRLPFLPVGNDLGDLGQPILMAQFVQGSQFPDTWEASPEF